MGIVEFPANRDRRACGSLGGMARQMWSIACLHLRKRGCSKRVLGPNKILALRQGPMRVRAGVVFQLHLPHNS